jgi:hypothetical protein
MDVKFQVISTSIECEGQFYVPSSPPPRRGVPAPSKWEEVVLSRDDKHIYESIYKLKRHVVA